MAVRRARRPGAGERRPDLFLGRSRHDSLSCCAHGARPESNAPTEGVESTSGRGVRILTYSTVFPPPPGRIRQRHRTPMLTALALSRSLGVLKDGRFASSLSTTF